MNALIFDIYKGTTGDGPGIRDTVFFKGCPLNCKWCHNLEGIDVKNRLWWEHKTCIGCGLCKDACKNNAIFVSADGVALSPQDCKLCSSCQNICPTKSISAIAKKYTLRQLTEEILKDLEYFKVSGGGVTASGGEAMMQYEFVYEFFSEMRKNGINTALDTTGFCDFEKLRKVLTYTDTVLYDLKVIDSQLHKEWTGVDNKIILENIKNISALIKTGLPIKLWIRTPIIPRFSDNEKVISEIADFIKANLSETVERWELCAFNNSCANKYKKLGKEWPFEKVELILKEKMNELKLIAQTSGAKEIVTSGILKN